MIFISHSSRNNGKALQIRSWLIEHGWRSQQIFFDAEDIVTGDRWRRALEKAGTSCQAVIVCLSDDWLKSDECKREYTLAEAAKKTILPIVVETITLPIPRFISDRQIPSIADPALEAASLERLHRDLVRQGIGPKQFRWPPPEEPERSVFRGLEAFEEVDAAIFFGRDAAITKGLDELRRMRGTAERMLVILGASGAGKSSFLRAGLMARLRRESHLFAALPVIRPGRAVLSGPLGLERALEDSLGESVDLSAGGQALVAAFERLREQVKQRHRQLVRLDDTADQTLPEGEEPVSVVVAIDQAEELYSADHGEASRFMVMLAEAIRADSNSLAIITIRSNAFHLLQNDPSLKQEELPVRPFNLPPMASGALKEVVEGPAALARPPFEIDPALTEHLLAEADSVDVLPFLSYALEGLARHAGSDRRLTLDSYCERLGSLERVIDDTAERAIAALKEHEKAQLPWLLRQLVAVQRSGGEAVQILRPLPLDEGVLARHSGSSALIVALVSARLLVEDQRQSADVRIVRVAHESVLRGWKAARETVAQHQRFYEDRASVQADYDSWRREGCLDGRLLPSTTLPAAEKLAVEFPDELGEPLLAYIQASRAAEEAARGKELLAAEALVAEKTKAAEAAEALSRQRVKAVRWYRGGAVVALGLMLAAVMGWWTASRQELAATLQRNRADESAMVARDQQADAIALLISSKLTDNGNTESKTDALNAMARGLRLLQTNESSVTDPNLSGLRYALYQGARWLQLLPTVVKVESGNQFNITGDITFSDSGRFIGIPTFHDGQPIVDAATGITQTLLQAPSKGVKSIYFDAAERRALLYQYFEQRVDVVDLADNKSVASLCVEVGHVCKHVATGFLGRRNWAFTIDYRAGIQLWDAEKWQPLSNGKRAASASPIVVLDVQQDVSGKSVAVLFAERIENDRPSHASVVVYSTENDWRTVRAQEYGLEPVQSPNWPRMGFVAEGTFAVLADGKLRVYRAASGENLFEADSVVVSDRRSWDTSRPAWVTASGDTQIFNVATQTALQLYSTSECAVTPTSLFVQHHAIYLIEEAGRVCIFDRQLNSVVALWENPAGGIADAVVSPNEDKIAIVNRDETVSVWPIGTLREFSPFSKATYTQTTDGFANAAGGKGHYIVRLSDNKHLTSSIKSLVGDGITEIELRLDSSEDQIDFQIDEKRKILFGADRQGTYFVASLEAQPRANAAPTLAIRPFATIKLPPVWLASFLDNPLQLLVRQENGCISVWQQRESTWIAGDCLGKGEWVGDVRPIRGTSLIAAKTLDGSTLVWSASEGGGAPALLKGPLDGDETTSDVFFRRSLRHSWDLVSATADERFIALGGRSGQVRLYRLADREMVAGVNLALWCASIDTLWEYRGKQSCLTNVRFEGERLRLKRIVNSGERDRWGRQLSNAEEMVWSPSPSVWRAPFQDIFSYLEAFKTARADSAIPRPSLSEWCSPDLVALLSADEPIGLSYKTFTFRAFQRYEAANRFAMRGAGSGAAIGQCPSWILKQWPREFLTALATSERTQPISLDDRFALSKWMSEEVSKRTTWRFPIAGILADLDIPSAVIVRDLQRGRASGCGVYSLAKSGDLSAVVLLAQWLAGTKGVQRTMKLPLVTEDYVVRLLSASPDKDTADRETALVLATQALERLSRFRSDQIVRDLEQLVFALAKQRPIGKSLAFRTDPFWRCK